MAGALANIVKGTSATSGLTTIPRVAGAPSSLTKGLPGSLQTGLAGTGITKGLPGSLQQPGSIPGHPTGLSTPASPAAASGSPAPAQTPAAPTPLDATYYAQVAANTAKLNSLQNTLNLTGAADQTTLQNTLGTLGYQQPRAELVLEDKANQGNSLFSTAYQQGLSDLVNKYSTAANKAQTTYATATDKLAAQLAADQAQYGTAGTADQADYAAAVARAITAAEKNPATGATPTAPVVAKTSEFAKGVPGKLKVLSRSNKSLPQLSSTQAVKTGNTLAG